MSYTNFVQLKLAAAATAAQTTLVVTTPAAPFAVPAANGSLTLLDIPGAPTKAEIVTYTTVTNNGDGTHTLGGVVRAREGTVAQAWAIGAGVFQSLTAAQYAADLGSKEPSITAGAASQMWLGNKTWASVLSQVQGTLLTGLNLTVGTAVAAGDNLLAAVGKLQKQISDITTGFAAGVRGVALAGYTTGANAAITASDTVLGALQKLQGQINARAPLTGAGASGTWGISITGSAASASAVAWSGVSGKPTTLADYGITNGYAMDGVNTGWFRSSNASGWYNETYGGGIYMSDATYVRTNKWFLCNGAMRVEGTAPQVQLWDSDHSILRYLYADGGSIGFLTSAGGWGLTNDDSGNTTSTGNVTAYSDIRLKKDIELIPDALDKVCALRGVTYERIDSGERQTGVIAQEVQAVLPEAVMTMTDEQQTLSVAYGNLVGLLIEAIKELKAEVDVLKQGAK